MQAVNRDLLWRWTFLLVAAMATAGLWRAGGQQAQAERAAMSTPCCIAVIDLNAVLSTLKERESREGELRTFIQSKESVLEAIGRQGKQLQTELEDMRKILPSGSPEAESKAEELVRLQMNLKAETELSKALVENKQKRMHLDLFNKINEATKRYADREGYQIVISSDASFRIPNSATEDQVQSAIVGRRVLHASAAVDISVGVAQMMNNEFGAR